jgi:hypothetical protein
MAARKGFKFERFRELCKEIGDRHAEMCKLVADSDAATAAAAGEDAPSAAVGAGTIKNTTAKPASDNSDAGTSWDPARQGQDSAPRRPRTMADCIPGLHRDTSHCK